MTIGGESGTDPVWFGFVVVLMIIFGIGYNKLVGWVERKRYMEGFTAIWVVGGVAMTLFGMLLVDPVAAVLMTILFVASGTPMIAGSILRYVQRREADQRSMREGPRD